MRYGRRNRLRVAALTLLVAIAHATTAFADTLAAVAQTSAAGTQDPSLLLILPTVNGVQRDVALMLRDDAGRYYVVAETLGDWRLAPPYPPPLDFGGYHFHALDSFPGVVAEISERSMTATIDVPPALLTATRRSLREDGTAVAPDRAFGAYLDYDVAFVDGDVAEGGFSSLLWPTLFTPHGNLEASLLRQPVSTPPASDAWVRLETAWSRDDPDKMRTLRVGDAVTPPGAWSRSLRFGGFQLGTNFATRPDAVTFPQPSIEGTAAMPSAVDILVNGTMRSRLQVPSGAFHIDDVPVVTGAGQLQVVTRDLMGREQLVTQDFYASERLLKRGLNEYSVNAGALRENFGLASAEYGDFMVAGLLRRGLSDLLTIEGRVEATTEVKTAGASIARAIGRYGVTSAAIAWSGAATSGTLWQVGHDYQAQTYRANLRIQGTSDFLQPGLDHLSAYPKFQIVASGGRNLGRMGSFGVAYVSERFADRGDDRELLTLTFSRLLPRSLLLSASGSYIAAGDGDFAASVLVSRALGPRSSSSSSLDLRGDESTLRLDHRYELPVGPGFGYRTSLSTGSDPGGDAEIAVNTTHARYSAEVSQRESGRGVRFQTQGSVATIGGGVFAARAIDDGFALVDAHGLEGVRVYLENREVGTTNRRGQLLVPGVRPYEGNRLRVESADLPPTARIGDPTLQIAPYYRSGAIASFPIDTSASVIVRVLGVDGTPLPEGARASVGDGGFRFPVGIDGRLYVQDVATSARVEVAYGSARCAFTLGNVPQSASKVPDLGDVVCRPVDEPASEPER